MMALAGAQRVTDESEAHGETENYPLARSGYGGGESLARRTDPQIRRAPSSGNLYDVLDLILDKGIVIDAFVRVSVVGIELITIDARVVVASVDTYLRYAHAAERLNIYDRDESTNLKEMTSGGGEGKHLKKGAERIGRALGVKGEDDGGGEDDEQEEDDDEGVGSKL